jgi:hypothetical protein
MPGIQEDVEVGIVWTVHVDCACGDYTKVLSPSSATQSKRASAVGRWNQHPHTLK